jgi:hypothetical protein
VSVIPLLSDLVDLFTGITSFITAFVLSFVTIVVSSLIHQPIVLAGSISVSLLVLYLGQFLRKAVRF